MNLKKMRTKLLASLCSVSLFFARRGDGVSRRWRIRGLGHGLGRRLAAPQWARTVARTNARPRERPSIQRPHTRENAIDTTRHRRKKHHTQRSADARRRYSSRSSPRFRSAGSAKKGGDLGMFRRGKMSAAFELAAFNLDVQALPKAVASSSGVHLIARACASKSRCLDTCGAAARRRRGRSSSPRYPPQPRVHRGPIGGRDGDAIDTPLCRTAWTSTEVSHDTSPRRLLLRC